MGGRLDREGVGTVVLTPKAGTEACVLESAVGCVDVAVLDLDRALVAVLEAVERAIEAARSIGLVSSALLAGLLVVYASRLLPLWAAGLAGFIVALASQLRRQLDSDEVAARATAFALASSEDRSYGIAVFGVEPQFEPAVSSIPGLVRDGRYLDGDDAAEIVVGKVLARNLRIGVGDELTLLGSGKDGSFAAVVAEVVGIFDSGVADLDRTIAEMPLRLFQDVFYMDGSGHQVVVNAPGLGQVAELKRRVAGLLPENRDLVVQDWDALLPGLKQAIQADISSAVFMYAVLVILVAFSVLNTQLMSVLERTHEFGIVLALGLKPGRLGRLPHGSRSQGASQSEHQLLRQHSTVQPDCYPCCTGVPEERAGDSSSST